MNILDFITPTNMATNLLAYLPIKCSFPPSLSHFPLSVSVTRPESVTAPVCETGCSAATSSSTGQ